MECLHLYSVLLLTLAAVHSQGDIYMMRSWRKHQLPHTLDMYHHVMYAVFNTDTFSVGFVETSFTVTEGGNVDVCVQLISPDNIGGAIIRLEVIDEDPPLIPADGTRAS